MLKEEGTQINIHLHFEMSDIVRGDPRPSIYITVSFRSGLFLFSHHSTSPRPSIRAHKLQDVWQQPVSHSSARRPPEPLRHAPSALASESD